MSTVVAGAALADYLFDLWRRCYENTPPGGDYGDGSPRPFPFEASKRARIASTQVAHDAFMSGHEGESR